MPECHLQKEKAYAIIKIPKKIVCEIQAFHAKEKQRSASSSVFHLRLVVVLIPV